MQVPSVPPPIVTNNVLPQDVVSKAVPNVQAMAPLIANAVAPSPKSEKSNQSRSNKNRDSSSEDHHPDPDTDGPDDKNKRGGSVNIRI